MALSTLGELQASIADWLNREDLAATIPDFINLAEQRINRDVRSYAIESSTDVELQWTEQFNPIGPPAGIGQVETFMVGGRVIPYVLYEDYHRAIEAGDEVWTLIDGKVWYSNYDSTDPFTPQEVPDGGVTVTFVADAPLTDDLLTDEELSGDPGNISIRFTFPAGVSVGDTLSWNLGTTPAPDVVLTQDHIDNGYLGVIPDNFADGEQITILAGGSRVDMVPVPVTTKTVTRVQSAPESLSVTFFGRQLSAIDFSDSSYSEGLLQEYPALFLYASLIEASIYLRDIEGISIYQARYDELISKLIKAYKRKRVAGGMAVSSVGGDY